MGNISTSDLAKTVRHGNISLLLRGNERSLPMQAAYSDVDILENKMTEVSDTIVCNNILRSFFQRGVSITYRELMDILSKVNSDFLSAQGLEISGDNGDCADVIFRKLEPSLDKPVSTYFHEKDDKAYFINLDNIQLMSG